MHCIVSDIESRECLYMEQSTVCLPVILVLFSDEYDAQFIDSCCRFAYLTSVFVDWFVQFQLC